MRSSKPSDSPSGACRDVYPLRAVRPTDTAVQVDEYLNRVRAEVAVLLKVYPHLEGEDPRTLLSRMVARPTVTYGGALRAAAFGVLLVRAVDRSEMADPTTGDAA